MNSKEKTVKNFKKFVTYYSWLQKYWVDLLIVLYILFIFYATLMPFEFIFNSRFLAHRFRRLDLLAFSRGGPFADRGDIVANIIFFFPLGFLLTLRKILKVYRHFYFREWFRIVLSGAALSFMVEFLQVFTFTRSPSLVDLTTNTIGTFLGGIFIYFLYSKFHREIKSFLFQAFAKKTEMILAGILFVFIILSQSAPFTFNISLYSVRTLLGEMLANRFRTYDIGSSLLVNLLNYGSFSYFLFSGMLRYHEKVLRKYWVPVVVGLLLFPFSLEMFQLLVPERDHRIMDILLGYVGILAGFLVFYFQYHLVFKKKWERGARQDYFFIKELRFFNLLGVVYFLFIFHHFLFPWDPGFSLVILKSRIHELLSISFWDISRDRFDLLMILIKDVFALMPAGFLLAFFWGIRNVGATTKWGWIGIAFAVCLGLGVLNLLISSHRILYIEFPLIAVGIWIGVKMWGIYLFMNNVNES